MQDKTTSHTPISTELNIAPRGKSWLHGQLIDGDHGHPTRQSMESAERAQAIQCTCPSGDGSLHWPCPAHPPTAIEASDERKDLVPGVMRCAKCEFQLVRQVLAVNLGEIFAGDSKTEPCPNGCGPLWPVTWKQYAEQAMDAAETMADRAFAAEKELKRLRGEFVQHADDVAVDALASLMKAKLAKQRDKGYGRWDTDCTRARLSELLRGHVDKGDPVDVANFCAFLLARGEGIAPLPKPGGWKAANEGIGEALQRACMDLPAGCEVVISLEKDAGTVHWFDQDGNEHTIHDDGGFAETINAATTAAIAAAKEK